MEWIKAYAHKYALYSHKVVPLSRGFWAAIKPAAPSSIDQGGLWSERAPLMDEMKELLSTDEAKKKKIINGPLGRHLFTANP